MSATIPAVHALHFLTLLTRWKVDQAALMTELGLSPEALTQPGARISLPTIEQLFARGRDLTGETALGFYLGWQMRVSAHGFLGFAAMTAATVRDALKLAVRFAPTHTDALRLVLREGPDTTSLLLEEQVDLGIAREVIVSALMVGIWQMGNALTGHQFGGEATVTFEEPADFARFKHLLTSPILFGQPENRLTFQSALLDLPLLLADPAAQQLAREQCERDLDALASTRTLVDRVRRLLQREDDGGFRTIHEVAHALHMSDRTLKRKLMGEGTSYVELLDAARKDRALSLLRTELSLEQVAEQVGYSELSNFTRAFRRWTGVTPRKFRVP